MLKRGFKSQCERRSVEYRKTLGLTAKCPLSALVMAAHTGAIVVGANEIEGLSAEHLRQLTVEDAKGWSALSIVKADTKIIIFNPAQSAPRINSVVMHELSHLILGHKLSNPSYSNEGHLLHGNFSKDDEDEADWLGATLLLPRPALLHVRQTQMPDLEIMAVYGVSREMFSWRLRMTGVDYQISASRRKK